MGLFGKKPVVIPEPDKNAINWFSTKEAEKLFKYSVRNNWDQMMQIWQAKGKWGIAPYARYGLDKLGEEAMPIAFFYEYLKAWKTMCSEHLAMNAVDLALDEESGEILYPNCFMKEHNPLVNFAIKIKPIFYSKHGESLEFNCGMMSMIAYLHDVYVNEGIDESNEKWIYEETLWFNQRGKERDSSEIISDIKAKVKHKEYVINF